MMTTRSVSKARHGFAGPQNSTKPRAGPIRPSGGCFGEISTTNLRPPLAAKATVKARAVGRQSGFHAGALRPICFGPFSFERNAAIVSAGSMTMLTVLRDPGRPIDVQPIRYLGLG